MSLLLIAWLSACAPQSPAATLPAATQSGSERNGTPAASPAFTADAPQPHDAEAAVAWRELREHSPADLVVLRPSYLPSGIGSTVSYSYSYGPSSEGSRYSVGYRGTPGVNVNFILGLVNSGFAERQEAITVRGQTGTLLISSQFPQLQVTWSERGLRYYIQANGITSEEMRKIATGLVEER
jgi:hypothetical protein